MDIGVNGIGADVRRQVELKAWKFDASYLTIEQYPRIFVDKKES